MRSHKLVAGTALLALALTACGGESGSGGVDSEYSLVLGHAGSTTDPRQWASEELASRLEERTDGQVTVEVHSDSTLGSWEEMIDGLQIGSTDIVIESILSLESYTDLAAVETAPFLYDSPEQFFEVWDGDLGEEIKTEITEESGYLMLGDLYRVARELTTKEPVTSLDDLQGMTVRTPSAQTMVDSWNALGARAEAMSFNEVYSALESGVLDAQENPLAESYFNSIHEVAPEITMTSHMYANYHFLMWEDSLDEYPEDIQEIIRDTTAEVGEEYRERTIENNEEYTSDLEAEGATFHELTDREDWVDETQSVRDDLPDQVREWTEEIAEIN